MQAYKYNIMPYSMENGIDEVIEISGNLIYVKETSGQDISVDIQPDSRGNDKITLYKGCGIKAKFNKIFLTADAVAGGSCEILITNDFDKFLLFDNVQYPEVNVSTTNNTSLDVAIKKVNSITTYYNNYIDLGSMNELTLIQFPRAGYYDITVSLASRTNYQYAITSTSSSSVPTNYQFELRRTDNSKTLKYPLYYFSQSTHHVKYERFYIDSALDYLIIKPRLGSALQSAGVICVVEEYES